MRLTLRKLIIIIKKQISGTYNYGLKLNNIVGKVFSFYKNFKKSFHLKGNAKSANISATNWPTSQVDQLQVGQLQVGQLQVLAGQLQVQVSQLGQVGQVGQVGQYKNNFDLFFWKNILPTEAI